jgi:hypothetical protein
VKTVDIVFTVVVLYGHGDVHRMGYISAMCFDKKTACGCLPVAAL